MNEEETLKELAQGFGSVAIGNKFFKSLAEYLAKVLGVDYVFIGELTRENRQVRSVAFYAIDKIIDDIEYPLPGSLCENVVRPNFCAYPSRVQELFPNNEALKRFGAESYVGTPLFDSQGKVLGLIYLMHSKPIDDLARTKSLLGIVAKRAELELEREQYERWLQEANQELEQRIALRTSALSESERALHQKVEQLQRITDDLESFLYTASHDLKAPMINIEGLIKVLTNKLSKKGWEDETTRAIIDMIGSSVGRYKETISHLTQMFEIGKESGQERISIQAAYVIKEVLSDMQEEIRESGAQIELDIQKCPPVIFSKHDLYSVISNLLSNAIKYRAFDRVLHIRISCHQSVDYVVLSVKDNGLGIDLQKESKIFSMFTRLHTHVEGSGIGLYMVKKMVENAGGKIKVESREGEGSTFSVYFKK